jgi:SAM-dependent methyltransferase
MARIEVTADQVEVAPCLLCGGDDCRIVWDARRYGYARCNACGLYYQRPRVLESVMLDLYGQSRDQASRRHAELVFDPEAPRARSILSDYRRTLERAMAYTPGRKLLEVGFGRGELLHCAREAGLEACGTELGEDHCALVRERLGVDTRAGDFLTMDFPEAPFDLVVIRHVLEHLYRPHQACERLHALLARGGILLVEIPNLHGLEYRTRRWFSAIGIGRRSGSG